MVHTDCHTKLFSPLTSVKTPCFYQKLSPKVLYFFHTVQNFGNFSLKDPKSTGIWEKKLCPLFLWLLSLKDPYFLPCMHMFERNLNVAPSNTVCRSWKILYSWNRIMQFGDTFRCNLIKVMKTKFQFYRLNRPICTLWMNFIWQDWYKGHHPSGQTRKGIYILQPPSVWLCTTWLSKQMPSVPEAVQAEAC